MNPSWQQEVQPGIAVHTIVREATAALVAMDNDRLEELARCCVDLNRELRSSFVFAQASESAAAIVADTELLGRILVETRANLEVLTRAHVVRLDELRASANGNKSHTVLGCDGQAYRTGAPYGDN